MTENIIKQDAKFKDNFHHNNNQYFLRQPLDDYAIYDLITDNGKSNGVVLVKEPINLDQSNLNKTWWFEGNLNSAIKKHKELTTSNDFAQWNFNVGVFNIEDNAKIILDSNPLYFDDHKRWWKWEEVRWLEVKEHEIINFIKYVFDAQGLSASKNRTTILNALKDETCNPKRKPKEPKETWVQFDNMVYDIKTGENFIASPKYFIKTILPYQLGTSEETPVIDKLFTDWLGDDKDILYDLCAYSISPVLFLDVLVFLVGRGSNGKSIFTKILNKLIGDDNVATKSLELLTDSKSKFQTGCLVNKYLLNLGDANYSEIKNAGALKELAGGSDKISGEIKGGSHFDFTNKAMVLGSFNTVPICREKTDGWYRRILLVQFLNKFKPKEVFNTIPEIEFYNLMFKSFNRLKELYQTREIKGKLSIENTKEVYENLSNPIRIFLKKDTVEDVKGAVTANKLYHEYKKFALEQGFNEFTFAEFITRFESAGVFEKKRMDVYYCDESKYCFRSFKNAPKKYNFEKGIIQKLTVYTGVYFKDQFKDDTKEEVEEVKEVDFTN